MARNFVSIARAFLGVILRKYIYHLTLTKNPRFTDFTVHFQHCQLKLFVFINFSTF